MFHVKREKKERKNNMTNLISSLLKQAETTPLITITGTFTTAEKLAKDAKKEYLKELKEDRIKDTLTLKQYTATYINANTLPVSELIEKIKGIIDPLYNEVANEQAKENS